MSTPDFNPVFHYIWNDAAAWQRNEELDLPENVQWGHEHSLRSIFHLYPQAQINVYSNTLPEDYYSSLQIPQSAITVKRFDLDQWALDTPVEGQLPKLNAWLAEPFGVVNIADLLRLLILHREGGIYLDFNDTMVLKPIDHLRNAIGWEHHGRLCNGVMSFEAGHSFLKQCLDAFFKNYQADVWGAQGPDLLTRVYFETGYLLNIDWPVATFNPIFWKKSGLYHYSGRISESFTQELIAFIEEHTLILHYYGSSQGMQHNGYQKGSVLEHFARRLTP